MAKLENADILSACAEPIISELYELAMADTRIMACNWLAYATRAIYRKANSIDGTIAVPTLDDCFSGSADTSAFSNNPKWSILTYWHSYHWGRAQEHEAEYADYFSITTIKLASAELTM